jgi:hypothetical protein
VTYVTGLRDFFDEASKRTVDNGHSFAVVPFIYSLREPLGSLSLFLLSYVRIFPGDQVLLRLLGEQPRIGSVAVTRFDHIGR